MKSIPFKGLDAMQDPSEMTETVSDRV